MMNNSLFAITIDCADATAVARFWADVLGRQVAESPTAEHAVVLAGDGATSGPRIAFTKVPEPKAVKNACTSISSATRSTPRPTAC